MKQILCYGDSHTWGYWGNDWTRFPFEERWPGRLEMLMGKEYRVIEEGLCSRTIAMEDAVQPFRNGLAYLQPCLMSHFPLDCLIVMLGTNDTKRRYGLAAQEIGLAMEELLKTVLGFFHWTGTRTKFLLIAPAPLQSYAGNFEMDGDSLKKSRMLAGIYQELARAYGVEFLDAGAFVRHYQADGCHFDREGHRELAQGVYDTLRGMQYQ